MDIELENRFCIIKLCSNKFKVMPNDNTVTCSNFCYEESNADSDKIKRRIKAQTLRFIQYRRENTINESTRLNNLFNS